MQAARWPAACTAHGYDNEAWLLDPDNKLQGISARPDACLLSYAVLKTEGAKAHSGSMHNLLGPNYLHSEQRPKLDWPEQVHPDAPHTFIWHTQEDATVPVENAYLMALGLQKHKIPHELHVFPKGAHGLGICSIDFRRQPSVEQWKPLAQNWLRELNF